MHAWQCKAKLTILEKQLEIRHGMLSEPYARSALNPQPPHPMRAVA